MYRFSFRRDVESMIKAMIIDDEKLIREGLVTYIDWEALGVEVCGVCGSCMEGLRMALEKRPQLILADICLPDASGLEMFEQIHGCGLMCQVIFISSYSEFKYAQQAVKLGAFDYLLKPIEADVLYDCVRRCVGKIRDTKAGRQPAYDRAGAGKVLYDVLTGGRQTDEAFFFVTEQMGVPKGCRPFLGVSVDQVDFFGEGRAAESFPVLAFLDARISERIVCCCFFTMPNQEEQVYEEMARVLEESVSEAVCLCDKNLSLGAYLQQMLCGLLLGKAGDKKCMPLYLPEKQSLAPEVIKSLDEQELKSGVFQFLEFCRGNHWTASYLDFQFECFKFLENVYKQLAWVYGSPLPSAVDMHAFIEQMRRPNNVYDLFFVLLGILEMVFAEVRRDCFQSPYTRKVLAIMRSRYGESLSLKSVARELHVSPSYLSSVFKADTGYPFSEYLFRYRMNMAYSLVRQGSLRVYEIGERVGYPDVAQFSKGFKKMFGYSPKQLLGRRGEEGGSPPGGWG